MKKKFAAVFLVFIVFIAANANSAQVQPTSRQVLKKGTEVTGPCSGSYCDIPDPIPMDYPCHNDIVWTEFGMYSEPTKDYDSNQVGKIQGGRGEACATYGIGGTAGPIILNDSGKYRMRTYHQVQDMTYGGYGWDTASDTTGTTDVFFTVEGSADDPCDGDQNRIVSLQNGNGVDLPKQTRESMGFKGDTLARGQTINVPKNIGGGGIEVQMGDGSVFRFAGGSKLKLGKCVKGSKSFELNITLLLGKIWAEVEAPFKSGNPPVIQTVRATAAVRGTKYSLAYDSAGQLTTLNVTEGKVAFRNLTGVNKKTLIVKAGQTATQKGSSPPELVK